MSSLFRHLRSPGTLKSRPAPLATPTLPAPPVKPQRLASVFIATHHRPELLKLSLGQFARMPVPPGWAVEILVSGVPGDPGKAVALQFPGVQYLDSPTEVVTDKMNLCLQAAQGELAILGDDDDIQPMNRISESIRAFEEGFDWSGSGDLWFYHPEPDRMVFWSGRSSRGLVGTSMSYSITMLRQAGGWPRRSKGKDGALAYRMTSLGAKFKDISLTVGQSLVGVQHGKNIWRRPPLAKGAKETQGRFQLEGRGTLEELQGQLDPTVVSALKAFRQTRAGIPRNQKSPDLLCTASMASIPGREDLLRQAVQSLLPQVDHLNVYLNEYPEVPTFLQGHPQITVARSQDHGNRGDAGKFFWSAGIEGYHFTCDDDIVYPPDYVTRAVKAVEHFGRRAVLSFHGTILRDNPKVYYEDRKVTYHCLRHVPRDHAVHVAGTGVMVYHASTIKVSPDLFRHPNMADMWMAKHCQECSIPQVVVNHPEGWIKTHRVVDTIYSRSARLKDGSFMDSSAVQNQVVREIPWVLFPIPLPPAARSGEKKVVVTVFTYNRPHQLRTLLQELRLEAQMPGFNVSVRVFDDASDMDNSEAERIASSEGWEYHKASQNHGKKKFWEWYTTALQGLRNTPADYYVFLPDDVRLCCGFVSRAVQSWEGIRDPRKATLNLMVNEGRQHKANWTGVLPSRNGRVWHTGWVDGLFICTRNTLEVLEFRITPQNRPWETQPLLGSGVGADMSRRLHRKGHTLYRVDRSLVVSYPFSTSKMNPQARKQVPLKTIQYIDEPQISGQRQVARVRGSRDYLIEVIPGDHVGRALSTGKFYEGEMLAAIRQMGVKGVYVDVGAFVGSHTTFFAGECPSSHVIAIEPQEVAYSRLVETIRQNRLNATAIHGAIHDEWARCSIQKPPLGNYGMAKVVEGGRIPCYDLDSLLEGQEIGLIKIDVEGKEISVLKSAHQTIERFRPVIITEAQTEDDLRLLKEALPGYAPSKSYNSTPTYIWTPS